MTIRVCVAAAFSAMIVGCASNPNNVSYRHITHNLSPELKGLAQRPADAHNARMYQENQNWRMISDDLAHVWYTDHPSRLSPYPVVYLSGQPR